jgi:hypothetical protein
LLKEEGDYLAAEGRFRDAAGDLDVAESTYAYALGYILRLQSALWLERAAGTGDEGAIELLGLPLSDG